MKQLRPLGTQWTEVFPTSIFTTDTRPSRHTFEVVAHVEADDGSVTEQVKCIKIEPLTAEEAEALASGK